MTKGKRITHGRRWKREKRLADKAGYKKTEMWKSRPKNRHRGREHDITKYKCTMEGLRRGSYEAG